MRLCSILLLSVVFVDGIIASAREEQIIEIQPGQKVDDYTGDAIDGRAAKEKETFKLMANDVIGPHDEVCNQIF
jgi:hypothetical protein